MAARHQKSESYLASPTDHTVYGTPAKRTKEEPMYNPRQLQTIAAHNRAEELRTAERERHARSANRVDRDIPVLSIRRQLRRALTAGVLAGPRRSTRLA